MKGQEDSAAAGARTGTGRVEALFPKRVTVFAGHFGSGKTEITINAALWASRGEAPVSVVDLDVVKPYFRTRSARAIFEAAGVELVAPAGELAAADLPIILPSVRERLVDRHRRVFLDAGGDDMGVRALSSVLDAVNTADTDFLLVLNFRRPLTPDVASAVDMASKIEAASRLKFTGAISNTHLIRETTAQLVREGHELARRAASELGIPLRMVAVDEALAPELRNDKELGCPLLVLSRVVRPPFENRPRQRTSGPLFKIGG